MPAKAHKITTDELYEAIRNSHGVTFEFVTGGVKYRAVLEHKENRERRVTTASTQQSPANSPVLERARKYSEQSLDDDELDKYWENIHDEWR